MMMMIKERRDMKPFLVKFGVALALSYAGYLCSRIRTKRIKPCDPPPSPVSECDKEVDDDGRSRVRDDPQTEINSFDAFDKQCVRVRVDKTSSNQVVKEFDVGNLTNEFRSFTVSKDLPKEFRNVERDDYEQEIEKLKRRIKFLVERERKLEVQLLEFYGLKEQETAMMELRNRLKIHSMEGKVFVMKIENLQQENKRLAEKVPDFSKVMTELQSAKAKIKLLKRTIKCDAEQNKEQILDLAQRVVKLQEQECEGNTSHSHSDDQSDIHRVAKLEAEAEGLRKRNEYLQQENTDLAQRLDSTQILANSLFEVPESEELHHAMFQLREENEKLKTEIERLEADRCADAEGIVYLRWINACLRYELRNYQPPLGKTVARDLSKCLSPTSEKKAKKLILEYANAEGGAGREAGLTDIDIDHWPSSQPYLTDSTDQDEFCDPSSSNKSHSKKVKFIGTLRKLFRGISINHHHHNHNDNHNQSTQASPMYRSLSVDDIGKRFFDAGHLNSRSYPHPQSPKSASSSQNLNNSLFENERLASLMEEDEGVSRMRHSRSSSSSNGVLFVLGRDNTGGSSPIHYTPERMSDCGQKSDLVKYAEVLRDNVGLQKHEKSASYHTR